MPRVVHVPITLRALGRRTCQISEISFEDDRYLHNGIGYYFPTVQNVSVFDRAQIT
jgi:hypothetical protein